MIRPTRRTQPYRSRAARQQTTALRAMQKGRHPLKHRAPGEVRRQAMKRRKTKRKSRARYSSPSQKVQRMRRRVSR
jgi:hypothetical protein